MIVYGPQMANITDLKISITNDITNIGLDKLKCASKGIGILPEFRKHSTGKPNFSYK